MGIPKGYVEVTDNSIPAGYSEVPTGYTEVQGSTATDYPLSSIPGKALVNFPGSVYDIGKAAVGAITSPVQTMEGISKAGRGAIDYLSPGFDPQNRPVAKAVGEDFIKAYGGWENIKRTIAEDPARFLADASTLLTGGGALVSKAPGILGKAGEAVRIAGETVNPITASVKAVGSVTSPAADWLSSRITESVYKLPVKTKIGKREAMTETIKDYGVQPSKAGWIKVKDTITDLNKQAAELKAYATETGQPVPQAAIVASLDDFAKTLEGSDLPKSAKAVVEGYKKRFIAEGKPAYTVSELDTLKASLDEALKPVYVGQMKINPGFRTSIINDAKQAMRQRVSELMKERVPGLAGLDKEQSRLLQIEPKIQEAANRIHNWSAVTLYDFLLAGGAYYTHAPLEAAASAVAWRVVRSPQVQQYAARVLRAASKATVPAAGVGNVALGGRALGLPNQLSP